MSTLSHHINTDPVESTESLTTLLHDLLIRARKYGASDAFASVSHDRGFSVDVRMGEVDTVAFHEDRDVAITVYLGNRQGSASSTDISPAALDAMVAAACDIAKVSSIDPCFGLADKALMRNEYRDLDLFHASTLTPAEAIEQALACEHEALDVDKRILNSDGVNITTNGSSYGFATSQDFSGVVHSSRHSVSCSLIAKDDSGMQRDYDYTTSRHPSNLVELNVLARSAVQRALSRLSARSVKTQKAPVIFSSRVSSGLIGAFIGAISGGNLYRKNTFLLDSLGTILFPENIHIYEQPHLLQGLGSAPFDNEGVPTRANVLVDSGRICQYVLSSYSARKMGLQTTANSGGVFNLTVDPTAGGLTELLQQMDTGLLVTELMGQGVNIITGDYSRGASGFWVEHGKIQYPVDNISIAGNLKNMFKGILAVGSDRDINLSTRCGSILIDEMMVAGE